jgi:S1-C subfamily serine protease
VWHAAADSVTPGTFLFTANAELVGVAAGGEAELVIVPALTFYAAAESLIGAPRVPSAGRVGVEVTTLTPPLAAATGVSAGVLVVAVESNGPATEHLRPGDVIAAVDDLAIATEADWRAAVGRARAGDEIRIRVASPQGVHEALIIAAPFATPAPAGFGAQLRRIGDRTEVVVVEPGSAAAEAGLIGGDVITRAGAVDDPTPRQILSALATEDTTPLLVLFIRAQMPHATAIAR